MRTVFERLQRHLAGGRLRWLQPPAQTTRTGCEAGLLLGPCRKLFDVTQSSTAPIAQEGLAHIQALYRIEKDLRGLSAVQRHAARQERSKPVIDAFGIWLAQNCARVSAKSPTGEALK